MNAENAKLFMREALIQAEKAYEAGEIPVGAVVVSGGKIIASAFNMRETLGDPTAHAEILVIRKAAEVLGDWRLSSCEIFVTLEPCAMCAGAIAGARLHALYFGAYNEAAGCAGSVYELCGDPSIGGGTRITGGILEDECGKLLAGFFKEKL